ncbi:IS3 family transposase [bacterium]|nr:IS3 family transposase [bacterium]
MHQLIADGGTCSRWRVARLMKKHGIRPKTKRKFKVTTQSAGGG